MTDRAYRAYRKIRMKVLVIIPAYNEEDSIKRVVESVIEAGYDYLVINDGSTDATLEICNSNGFNVLNLKQNLGIGGAVQAGHKYALSRGYDADVQFDGDGQHDAYCIADLLDQLHHGYDLAIGSRFLVHTDGFQSSPIRRLGIKWLSFWISTLTRTPVTDPTSGFRACSRKAIALFCKDYPTDYPEPESIVAACKSSLKISETSVIMHERQGGSSSIGALSAIYYMIKVTISIAIRAFMK